jgi:hypothetical protein
MFRCDPVKSLKIPADAVLETVSFIGEQLDDGAGNNIVRMKYAKQQLRALPYLEAVSAH